MPYAGGNAAHENLGVGFEAEGGVGMRQADFRGGEGARRRPGSLACTILAFLGLMATAAGGRAEPWLEVGDRSLRGDVEILAAAGLIQGTVTTWPVPRGQILSGLSDQARLEKQPAYVQAAAQRLLAYFSRHAEPEPLQPLASGRFTNRADVIRDFGTMARNDVDVRGGAEWSGGWADARLLVGDQSQFNTHQTRLSFDDSFLSARAGNWLFYGGWVDQWYGPGWISSLTLSNNARPTPKIGLMRDNPHAFESPWLSWIGPWQFNTFVGVLDGPRVDRNTLLAGMRLTFEPVRDLEFGLTRISELCGANHPCHWWSEEFHFQNSNQHPNPVNDEATVDARYTVRLGGLIVSPYIQMMDEDTGPFTHSNTSYLIGDSLAGPFGSDGSRWRVVAEYTDTIATANWFSFGAGSQRHGAAYNDYKYIDGWRYRGQSMGFSLDSDSRLLSLMGLLTDNRGWTYRLVYYRANISTSDLAGNLPPVSHGQPYRSFNAVSAYPVQYDQVEAGVSIPYRRLRFDVDVRAQDGQPYPRDGGLFSAEAGISYGF
jgi:hypothetical protein